MINSWLIHILEKYYGIVKFIKIVILQKYLKDI